MRVVCMLNISRAEKEHSKEIIGAKNYIERGKVLQLCVIIDFTS